MTNDRVDDVLDAYLDHLEEGAPEPSLDHLDEDERQLAQDLIDSLKAARGIDPYESRPTIEMLLEGTEFEDSLSPHVEAITSRLSVDSIDDEVRAALGPAARVIPDVVAQAEGIESDAEVLWKGVRLRLRFCRDVRTIAGLKQMHPRTATGAIFGRFPETDGVILVLEDPEFSSVAVGPYDAHDVIGAPDGALHQPRITRAVLSLPSTLRSYIEEVAPNLTLDELDNRVAPIDPEPIYEAAVAEACREVVEKGGRAKISAKKKVWGDFEKTGSAFVADLVRGVAEGRIAPDEIGDTIERDAVAA